MRRILLAAGACLLLAACTGGPRPTASTATTPEPSATTSPGSLPPPGTLSPAPSPSGTVPNTPSVPPVAGALDVSTYRSADFSTPSGRMWCGVRKGWALCHFPEGFQGKIPDEKKLCPNVIVSGVMVDRKGTDWFCSGDPEAFPMTGEPGVAWHRDTGFGFVKSGDFTLAVLPYGQALRNGDTVCRSERTGVTCGNRRTGHGFNLARAGVVFF